MDEKTKVLYIHGLESGPNGLKANVLRKHYKYFSCPHLRTPMNILSSFSTVIREVRAFKPDVIIGSSYGSILLMFLLQMGIWNGPSIILSCAMQLIAKHRMYIPYNIESEKIFIVHGNHDTLCDIVPVRKMSHTYGIDMIELNDTHSLKTVCTLLVKDNEENIITSIINRLNRVNSEKATIEYETNVSTYLFKLAFILLWSLIRYPFNLLLT